MNVIVQMLVEARLPEPHRVELLDEKIFSWRQIVRVDPRFTETYLDPFISDARLVRRLPLIRSQYNKRHVGFVNATYVLFCPPEGGTSLVTTKSVLLQDLRKAAVRFHDLIGIQLGMKQPRSVVQSIPQPRRRGRVALPA